MNSPQKIIAFSQTILGLCLLSCLILIPRYFFSLDQGGVSNYGTEPKTQWLYVIGFSAASTGAMLAALRLPLVTRHRQALRLALAILAIMYLLVMLSTFAYKASDSLRELHEHTAMTLFAIMLAEALWLRFVAVRDRSINTAFVIFCIAFGAGLLTVAGVLHVLFSVQIICGASFAYMLTHSTAKHRPDG